MKQIMHIDVSNTTTTISETPRTASGTLTCESSTKSFKSVENGLSLNSFA